MSRSNRSRVADERIAMRLELAEAHNDSFWDEVPWDNPFTPGLIEALLFRRLIDDWADLIADSGQTVDEWFEGIVSPSATESSLYRSLKMR